MILQALDRYYDRMAARRATAPLGYVEQKIGYALVLSPTGEVEEVCSLGDASKKNIVRTFVVPAPITEPKARTAGSIVPYFLWDKPSYLLGIKTGETNTERKYAASRALHLQWLADASDPILIAVKTYFERYPLGVPEHVIPPEYRDRPYVFRTVGSNICAHETAEAQELWLKFQPRGDADISMCLVTGKIAPIARLHPKISGFKDADTLVGFNADAFKSYGKEQGANAPTSELAAFRYGAVLNRLLDRNTSRNRLKREIGDATVVFWADASSLEPDAQVADKMASDSEDVFAGLFDPPPEKPAQTAAASTTDESESAKLRDALGRVAQGRPAREVFPGVAEGVRFHVLGLAPNAARLSVRFWLADTFQHFVDRLGAHWRDLAIEPKPRDWGDAPAIQRLLVKTTALQEKFENIPPLLAGEVTRAVLGGTRYPRTLLAAALMRLRAGDDPGNGWHAAAIRAVLARDARLAARAGDPHAQEPPVSLDRNDPSPAYQLGRLFATLETAQRQALGKVNATIRDRYFGAASATPASVFPLLLRGVQSHLGKLRKDGKGGWIEREIEEITDRLPPALPRSLKLDAQGRFAIGYYHQRRAQFTSRGDEIETGETQDGDE